SGCAAEVTTKLAMPLRRQNGSSTIIYDPAQGGWLGRASDIASATHRGLHDALRRSGPGRIIINLSLGWDGAWGGALAGGVSSLSLGQQMVYAALEEAACQEALVVAAVGNSAGYGSDGGPAYPAAWEKELAPTSARCAAFGLGGSGAPGGVYRPLLYAASAVDGQDQPLPSQRPGSLTRFAAPGGHVAISYGGWSSTLYTGTSMASAVVSAAAAVAWGYDPSLRPDQVMDLVHVAGANLATAPELCLGNACGGMNVKRVSLCATVRRSCNATNACGPVLCPARPPGRDDRPTGIDYSVPVGTTYLYRNATSFNPPAPCTGSVYAINSSSLDSACPFDEFLSRHVAPFGVPQPPINGCPNCGMNQNSVEIGVSDDVSGTLDDAVLNVTYTDGTEDQIALDNLGPLTGGDTVQIDVEDNLAGTVDQASIEFSYDGNYSSFSDLHVEN
ncbi:MAG: S8/S53 family peptidase, partial [Myxococcota bacterium]